MKKKLFSFILFTFLFLLSTTVYASNQETSTDNEFVNLSIEEKIKWMDENIPPIILQAEELPSTRSMTRYYQKTTYSNYTHLNTLYFELGATFNWSVDSATNEITTYSMRDPYTRDYIGLLPPRYEFNSFYLFPTNVKCYLQGNFIAPFSGVNLYQNINLHSSGAMSFAEYSAVYN